MKNVFLSILLVLTACGGVGTEPKSEGDADGTGTELEKGLADDQSCTEDVKVSIEKVVELCAANMNVDINRTLCLVEAKSLNSKHPNFVCTLESGQLIDASFIQKNFITSIEDRR